MANTQNFRINKTNPRALTPAVNEHKKNESYGVAMTMFNETIEGKKTWKQIRKKKLDYIFLIVFNFPKISTIKKLSLI
jgi:hypothetical protein